MTATLELDDLPALAGLRRVAVAYSGGRDSTVLLHLACRWAARHDADVHALHIQHGLSPNASAWEVHAAEQVRAWASWCRVELRVRRLGLVVPPGASLEAHARTARYRALADLAREAGCGTVLLAHHRDDQVETFVLQALRGAGAAGLSAMPMDIEREGVRWVRPWLDRPRADLERHRMAHRLSHVEDESNADPRHARNRLRQVVLPALRSAFPRADEALSTAVRMAQDARACLDALARIDLAVVRVDDGGQALSLARLAALDPARRRNLLRCWLIERTGQAPAQSLLQRLADEPLRSSGGRWLAKGGAVRMHRGCLCWVADVAALAARPASENLPPCQLLLRAGRHEMPAWHGALVIEPTDVGGIAQAGLAGITLHARRGGEQFQAHVRGVPRGLKKQFQSAGVPAWAREAPLVWRGDALVFVPALGIDARALAPVGQPQWRLIWERWPLPDR